MANEAPRGDSADHLAPPAEETVAVAVAVVVSSSETAAAEVKKETVGAGGGDGGGCVVIDVGDGQGGGEGFLEGEKVCRICHLSWERRVDGLDLLIRLGCGCKEDLGIAHVHCAEAWFKLRGNRFCEICGEPAKNITGVGDNRFMEEWNERSDVVGGNNSGSSSEQGCCWRGRSFCNFLIGILVIAFILPWFFRVNMF
ncbi:hypothetical protein QJS04_geneDACA012734 [Acorus gramineus]|uniref:RING-CH-type domain-containing protein n=1 Tax=Acorus gramineus TaxID=55184 RepID=A0AAV9A279_ACOGR|nr:hypothetical protein QJS04_geneDACA012734 [Acorus gramineus]